MTTTDDLLQRNAAYAESFSRGDLAMPPARKVAVLACMDARLDVHQILGLEVGDAHVIRNAGGVATDDLLQRNAAYAESFSRGDLAMPPARKVAVLACMDARLDVHQILGLEVGDAAATYASVSSGA